MAIQVKKEFKGVVIGFNNSPLPLGQRNDLHILYEMAKEHNIKEYLDMFEMPTEKEIETAKIESFQKRQSTRNRALKKSKN